MAKYALVNNTTNEVENIEEYETTPSNPSGFTYYQYTDELVHIGGTRNSDGTYTLSDYTLTDDDVADIRIEKLVESDFIVTRHRDQVAEGVTTTITGTEYQSWLTYRQALRDLPTQAGYPSTVTWPTKP